MDNKKEVTMEDFAKDIVEVFKAQNECIKKPDEGSMKRVKELEEQFMKKY